MFNRFKLLTDYKVFKMKRNKLIVKLKTNTKPSQGFYFFSFASATSWEGGTGSASTPWRIVPSGEGRTGSVSVLLGTAVRGIACGG